MLMYVNVIFSIVFLQIFSCKIIIKVVNKKLLWIRELNFKNTTDYNLNFELTFKHAEIIFFSLTFKLPVLSYNKYWPIN